VIGQARNMELKPTKNAYEDLEFMFESSYMLRITKWVMDESMIDHTYEHVRIQIFLVISLILISDGRSFKTISVRRSERFPMIFTSNTYLL
jgi:hypothetical protein